MSEIKYFADKKGRRFVVSEKLIICEKCSEVCSEFIILKQYFHKGRVKRFVLCSNVCSKKVDFIGDAEIGSYLITDFIKEDFVFIQPEKLDFQYSNKINSFDACKLDSRTIDKTYFSGRESLEGATIGKPIKEITQEKDVPLNEIKAFKLIEELGNPKNLISNNKKKLLKWGVEIWCGKKSIM